MTEKNPAVFLQAGSTPAEDVRRMLGMLASDSAQINGGGDLLVTATGTGLQVSVAPGRAFIPGTEATYQGTYFVENRGAATLTLNPSDSSLKRIDLIVAKVQDAQYSGATNAWSLAVVTGTLASTPIAPNAPVNSVVLAQISITAGLSTLTSAYITDTRPGAYESGPVLARGAASYPANPFDGQLVFDLSKGTLFRWVASASAWRQVKGTAYRGTASGNTDANGYATITHNLGFAPSSINALSTQGGNTLANTAIVMTIDQANSTTFRVRFMSFAAISGSNWVMNLAASQAYAITWQAFE